jgi:hypothetical protein
VAQPSQAGLPPVAPRHLGLSPMTFYEDSEPPLPQPGDIITFLREEDGEIVGEVLLEVTSAAPDGAFHAIQASPWLHRDD